MTQIVPRALTETYSSVYDFFKLGFYTNAIGSGKSILFDRENVWTEGNLIVILKNFDKEELTKMRETEDSEDTELFWKRLKDQFKDVGNSEKFAIYCLLADLMALHYVLR